MQKLVSAVFATILLATGLPLVIAQNSNTNNASPAPTATASTNPDVATKKDIAALKGTIAKTAKQQEAQRKADADRTAQQLNDLFASQEAKRHTDAQQAQKDSREAQAKLDAAKAVRQHELEVICTLILCVVILIMVQTRKSSSAPPVASATPMVKEILPLVANASTAEVKAYAKANPDFGGSFDFPFDVKVDDPNNPGAKIFVDTITGKVHKAGTKDEYYAIDGQTANRKEYARLFRDAYYAREAKKKIHAVTAA